MSGSGGLPSLLSDFGQKIDLCSRIREILVNYPPGTTILKEFVQNADDAGASKIVFCLDKRTFGTEKLAHERMSSFQGHSLLVHNDAVFSDVDFESIQNIGELTSQGQEGMHFSRHARGHRRAEHSDLLGERLTPVSDALYLCLCCLCHGLFVCVFTVNVFACDFVLCSHVCVLMFCTGGSQKLEALVKTGRFGIGFNSCYHICEMPTFLSRDRLVMFDPQTKYLPDVNANNPGKCINVRGSLLPFYFLPSSLLFARQCPTPAQAGFRKREGESGGWGGGPVHSSCLHRIGCTVWMPSSCACLSNAPCS